MTSGSFISLSLSSIIVNRVERQRRELPNLDILADSIKRLGLIHPLVVRRENNELVAGERRLEACRSLGWTNVNCQYLDELDPLTAHAIELEENIKREALPWQDEAKAVAEYHMLRASQEAEWSQTDTAKALGLSESTVVDKLRVAKEIESGNTMVIEAPKFSTARGIVRRAESRRAEADILAIGGAVAPAVETPDGPILNLDFREWAPAYSGPKFNFIHCDFPYGIGANKFVQGAAATHGGYEDSEDTYWNLCISLAAHLDRIAAPSAHFMFWFSMHYYTETLAFFEKNTDIQFDPFPLVWTKSDNIGIIPDPERGPRRIYETALFGSRGDRKIVRSVSNSAYEPSERSEHMSIKPPGMLRKFFSMFVDSSTRFLDPTCGSGSSLQAATELGAQSVTGLELNPGFAERANLRYLKGLNNENRTSGLDPNKVGQVENNSAKLAAS